MAKTALFMGPMARKKRVNEKYNPSSYRVISHEAEKTDRPTILSKIASPMDLNMLGQSVEPNLLEEHRKNRPNPTSVGFLRQDVRLLNEPLCHVRTRETATEQHQWWPSRANEDPMKRPPHTLDTTFRDDYQYRGKERRGSARHTANPNKQPALGSVPVNFLREPGGQQRFWKEGISYEHQYNCRAEPQYPIRAKRHGAFVWDRFSKAEVERMIDHYGIAKKPATAIARSEPSAQLPLSAPASADPRPEERPSLASHTPVLPPIGY